MKFTSDEIEYGVVEFFERFGKSLPKIVKVSQGYCGEITDDTFDRDQVIRLHCISRQKRVVAKTQLRGKQKYFSIPLDYHNMKLCVIDKKGKAGKETDLARIVKKEKALPLTVEFPKDKVITVGSGHIGTNNLPRLELTHVFDEIYFLGNCINDGQMSPAVINVPLYLSQLRLSFITGILGQNHDIWERYQIMLSKTAEMLEYKTDFGNPEMAEYHEASIKETADELYSYITPVHYYNLLSFFATSRSTETGRSHKMEENGVHLDKHATVIQAEHLGDSVGGHDIGEPAESSASPYEFIDNGGVKRKPPIPKSPVAKNPTIKAEQTLNSGIHSIAPKYTHLQKPIPPKPVLQKPDIQREKTQKTSRRYENDLPLGHVAPFTRTTEKNTLISREIPNVTLTCTDEYETFGDVISKDASKVAELPQITSTNSKNQLTPVSGPKDVTRLSIDEVSEYLRTLGLDAYTGAFKREQIDGELLSELDKDILKEFFGMNVIEAHRLMKFVAKGHVPR